MEARLSHSQQLSQILAPQMQQSLKILQTPTMELRQLIEQEMAANPVLEMEAPEVSVEEQQLDKDPDDFDREFEHLSRMDEEWRDYLAQSRSSNQMGKEAEERRQFMFDSLVAHVTLQEHLLEQLKSEVTLDEDLEIGEFLIGNLDEKGFFQSSLEDLAFSSGIPLSKLQKLKNVIQQFHPFGVGAEDLRESLLVQLERKNQQGSQAWKIVHDYLDLLASRKIPQIAQKMGIPVEAVNRAAQVIAALNPRPGHEFSPSVNPYVTPDVLIHRDGDAWVVTLNQEDLPRLRISNYYKALMTDGGSDGEVRHYIRERIKSGKLLIRSVHQRQETIRRIAEEIASRQEEFLLKGRSYLKPMTMSQVADAVGVHETTVSRAVSGKYLSTPQGVFEMKFFFSTGYTTEAGESVSNTSVKDAIAEIVDKEPPGKPLSDEQLVKELEKRSIKIARRTVAKYREELNILPSHLRKKF